MSGSAKRGHLDVVKFFLASTVQPAPFNWFGMMQNACTEGHVDMVRALWDHRRDCRPHGDLKLLRAAERGHVQVVRFFVEQNKIKHVEDAMFSAALDGHLETVKYLVELNYVTQVQHAVEGAAHYGHLEVVKYLVQRQFEIHLEPAFVAAAKRGHLDIVRYCDCVRGSKTFTRACRALFHPALQAQVKRSVGPSCNEWPLDLHTCSPSCPSWSSNA
ncbi:unnamed protein product [Aphanomyces euteiches]